jgi:hypothetical protein
MNQISSAGDETTYDGTRPVFSPLPYIIIIITFLMVATIGMIITPSLDGVGTHEKLGLPPCGFLVITGYPCPSCGLTTAFTLILHGRIIDAFIVQPFGVMLFIAFFIVSCMSVAALFMRLPFCLILDSRHFERVQMILLISMLLAWIYKIYIMKWK